MKKLLPQLNRTIIVFLFCNLCMIASALGQATVMTDKPDYQPGDYVIVTGTGWEPGETVALDFEETPSVCPNGHLRYTVADADGNILYDDFLINSYHLGVSFVLTATGQSSGLTAQTTFTDALFFSSAFTVVPTTICPESVGSYTIRITNNTTSASPNPNAALGSGKIQIPGDFSNVSSISYTTFPSGKAFSVGLGSGGDADKIIFTRTASPPDPLEPGEYISITFTATAATTSGSYEWTTEAWVGSTFNATKYPAPTPAQPSITVNALPTVSITGLNPAYCKDATAVTLAGSPSGGSFTIDGNSATSFDPAALSNGSHTVVYTYTDGNGCTNTATQNVTVNALPTVSITGLNPAYCKDATAVTLAGSPSGGSFTIDGNPATSFDPAALSNGSHTVVYTYTDGNGCTNTASQNVTVNALPTVSITGLNPAYCKDATAVTLAGTPSGGSFTIDGNPATSFDPAELSNASHTVVYTYADGNGCTNTASQNVTVNALPTVSITGLNPAYCKDATAVTLAGSPSGGSFTIDGNPATSFDPAELSNGSHTVVYTYTDGNGCTNTASQNVSVNALPTVSITGLNPAYCKDATAVTLAGTPSGGSFTIDGNSATSFDPAELSNGSHTVVYTYTDGNGCTNTASQNVTVNALPTVSITGLNPAYCKDATAVTLAGSPTGGSFTIDGNPASSFDPAALSNGSHAVVYTYTDGNGCTNTASQNVSVNALPTVSITGLNPAYCKDATAVTLAGSPAGGSFTIDGNPATSFDPAALSNGSHTVIYTYTDGNGCTNTASQNVQVNALPVVSITGLNAAYCKDATAITLAGSPSGGSFTIDGNNATSFNPANLSNGSHTVVYTYTDGNGCTNTATQNVMVNALPVASISPNTPGTTTICNGGSLVLTGSASGGSGGGYEYNWNSSGYSATNTLSVTNAVSSSNNTLIVKDGNGCGSAEVSQTVTVNTVTGGVIAKGTMPGPGCGSLNPGQFSSTSAATGSGTLAYTWEISTDGGDTWVSAPPTEGVPPPNIYNPGSITTTTRYRRVATYTLNGIPCLAYSNELIFIVNPLPTVSAISPGGTTNVCLNGTLQLSNSTPSGVWTSSNDLLATVDNTGLVTGVALGSPIISYTVTDATTSCSRTVNKTVHVIALPVVAVSNACIGGGTITFTQSGGTTGGTWTVSGGGTINAFTGIFTPLTAGCFTVTYSAPPSGSGDVVCSDTKSFVVFPAAPSIVSAGNTCNTAFLLPEVTAVDGFNVEYDINNTGFTSSPVIPTTPGCHSIKARYVLASTCGTTIAGTAGSGNCSSSNIVYSVIFPTAPSTPVIANTCNTAITVPALTPVAGFTAQYSFNGVWGTSNVSSTTPGCYAVKTRYVLTATCGTTLADANGTGNCNESGEAKAVIFPTAPSTPVIANTCNTAITVPALTPVAGFTAQYSFNGVWGTSNVSSSTPGCYAVKTRYVLTATCGSTLADANGTGNCNESGEAKAVIFPTAPSTPVISNTCNTAITVPALTPVADFTAQYSFNGVWGTSNVSSTTPGCYAVKTRYVLTATCGSTLADANGTGNCNESGEAKAVIFPTAPSTPVISNTCNTAITVPALTPVAGFTAQYSFNGVWGTSNVSSTTPGCYAVKTRYVLTATCGATLADANGTGNCNESGEAKAVIFPTAPSTPVIANTCNTAITVPALTPVAGFTAQYSFNGVWGTSNVSSTTPGCYAVKTRYVLTATCGATLADANGTGNCNESGEAKAVIFPTAPSTPVISNTCNTAITVPALTPVAGFTAQYSFNGVWGTSNVSSSTPGCYAVKTRYVLTATCGSTLADANGTGNCNESGEASAVVFPSAPSTVVVNTGVGPIIVTPPATIPGFNIEYSFNDGQSWGANTPPTADNCAGYKIKTRYVTAAVCGNTAAGTASTVTACKESPAVIRIVDNTAPTITCANNITVNTNSEHCYATVTLTAPQTGDNCGVASVTNNAPSTYPLGETIVTWTVTDVNGLTNTCTQKVYVDRITTTRTVTVQPSSQQYSDKVTFTATVTPYNCAGANPIGGSVKFKIGSLEMGTAPIINGVATLANVPLLEDQLYDEYPDNAMNATDGPLKPAEDKIVTALFINTDPRYIVGDVTTTLDVTCEDADLVYNGQTYFTVNPNNLEGVITLSASVVDKNEGDPSTRGDIRNATVSFREGSVNGTVIGTPNIPVGLVNPDNKQEGIVTTDFEDNLTSSQAGSGGKVYEIFAGVNNYYCGNTGPDGYTTVTLAMPGQDFVTGGGYINMQNSAGTYAGTNGKRMNFGLVMKWNSSGKNLQGSVNIIYRKVVDGVTRIYQIKSNAINSLAVANVNDNGQVVTGNAITFRRATISTKANLRDITDPLNPISLGGNLAFTVIAWESTTVTTGALDRISVQLVGSGSTGLLFASSWSGGNAVWTQLAGGKIQARNPSVPATSVITQAPKNEEEVKPGDAMQQLGVKVFGNPSETQFVLMPESSSAGLISIRVMDIHGRVLEKKENIVSGQAVRFGNNFKAGTYFAELIQGSQRKVVTLVKQ